MKAVNLLRKDLHYRRDAFDEGLKKAGYLLVNELHSPKPGDALLIWNRYDYGHELAKRYEQVGATVYVAENGYLGKDWAGGTYFALALSHHNGAGRWLAGPALRWDGYDVKLQPWRQPGGETVILPQRGIGEPGVRMEPYWLQEMQRRFPKARVRPHPGVNKTVKPLEDDLQNASQVVTWGSGAALKALILGIPVVYGLRSWIGALASTHLSESAVAVPGDRLAMFRRLAWAQWTLEEIASGYPFLTLKGLQ